MPQPANVEIRRATDRAVTAMPWLTSRHSFSFGDYYDPANTHHGLLLVNNDDIVSPRTGFRTHPHRDMEIVTWVLQGELTHQDSSGNHGLIYPGLAQRMSAGSGILHSERNESPTEQVHFVQMWVVPDEAGLSPSYQQHELENDWANEGLVTIASGDRKHNAPLALHNRNAALHTARLQPEDTVSLPAAPYLHLFITRGRVAVEGMADLEEGDAVRFTDAEARRVTAYEPAEVLIWEMHGKLGG